jgi:hypothetical protein
MQPLYFNPLDNTGNFIGTNPLTPTDVAVKTSFYPYFNPSLYQSFTFYSFPAQSENMSLFLGIASSFQTLGIGSISSVPLGENTISGTTYQTWECLSLVTVFVNSYFTSANVYVSDLQIQPVTYSIRFGTELQTIYGSYASGATGTSYTYNTVLPLYYEYCSTAVKSYLEYIYLGENSISGVEYLGSFPNIDAITTTTFSNPYQNPFGSIRAIGSSSFVDLMGSNVFTGLIDTTNSIIIYQNEQVNSYYSQSLSYQVNISNLTAALNSVSTTSNKDALGSGTITISSFYWSWYPTQEGYAGTPYYSYYQSIVNAYLWGTYNASITNSTVAVTQVQSLITVQNNDLANSQTFMNNAVTTLQSQVSLAGQIIGTLSSIMQSIIGNI